MVAMIVSRRGMWVVLSSLVRQTQRAHFTLDNVADLICHCTPQELRQVVSNSTGGWLYRGHDWANNQNSNRDYQLLHPKPDLLIPGTYDDEHAVDYFQGLENHLINFKVRPSTGHIATSILQDAALWGEAVSVWPLGNRFEYAWPRDREVFFPSGSECAACDYDYRQDFIQVNEGLEKAMEQGREVLFTSWWDEKGREELQQKVLSLDKDMAKLIDPSWTAAFLVVSLEHRDELKHLLVQRTHGL